MLNLSREELVLLVKNYYDDITVVVALVAIIAVTTYLASKASWERAKNVKEDNIPGCLGLPFIGETFSFLSANKSTRGCYDFVRVRRLRYGRWFRTRLFGKTHIFVPNPEGAKTIFANDFVQFNKGYVKSMADAVGEKSLLCVPVESHKRIRRLLSEPFSMTSLSSFVIKFDKMLCARLQKLEESGISFKVLDFCMKMTFDAMCDMLMSITEDSLLQQIEKECTAVSDAMLSFPVMIPGTRYYKGIMARRWLMKTFSEIIARRRRGDKSQRDFLQSMLQRDSYADSEKLDDSEIMDNLLTLIIAGQTTTAAAMMWSVKFLHDNTEAQHILREEQLSLAKMKPDGAPLNHEDLNNMCYGFKKHCRRNHHQRRHNHHRHHPWRLRPKIWNSQSRELQDCSVSIEWICTLMRCFDWSSPSTAAQSPLPPSDETPPSSLTTSQEKIQKVMLSRRMVRVR